MGSTQGEASARELRVRIDDGVVVIVPPTLATITTYVLLEQETWFEKEAAFVRRWLKPGMTAIDIGANFGVFSLPMARLTGPAGRVFAYEPASAPRAFLERSKAANGCGNLEITAAALSDRGGRGRLARGESSEYGALDGRGPAEEVEVATLDAEDAQGRWAPPDFVKIDAEGAEGRILAGGRRFFERHSPLVMFEVRQETSPNSRLIEAFRAAGYALFRSLPGAPLLLPVPPNGAIDPFELNLFAAKPDRVAALAEEGLLVTEVPEWRADAEADARATDMRRATAFADEFAVMRSDIELTPDYRFALTAYAAWRSAEIPLESRGAALAAAFRHARTACEREFRFSTWSTFARIAWEAGERAACVKALATFIQRTAGGPLLIGEPFWPACARYDATAPRGNGGNWLIAAAVEQFERARAYSSYFSPAHWSLDWLCRQPYAGAEMERRRVLQASRAGGSPLVPARLKVAADDHLNAELWRGGLVPGTRVA